jgi:hypothetical protein
LLQQQSALPDIECGDLIVCALINQATLIGIMANESKSMQGLVESRRLAVLTGRDCCAVVGGVQRVWRMKLFVGGTASHLAALFLSLSCQQPSCCHFMIAPQRLTTIIVIVIIINPLAPPQPL